MAEKVFVTDAQVKAAQMIVDRDKAMGRESDDAILKIAGQARAEETRLRAVPAEHQGSGGGSAVTRLPRSHRSRRISGLTLPLGRRLRLRLEIDRSVAHSDPSPDSENWVPGAARPAGVSFWDALDPAEREALGLAGSWRTFATGTRLMQEGESADYVAVILGGRIKISVDEGGRERVLAIRGLGQLIGERAALQVKVRSATVTALEMVWALVVQAGDFKEFTRDHPHVSNIVEDQLYDRLTEAPYGYEQEEEERKRIHPYTSGEISAGGRPASDFAASYPRHQLKPLNGENCTILLSEVMGFGAPARSGDNRRLIREALLSMTGAALRGMSDVRTEDRGDGFLTVLSPSVSTAEVMGSLLKDLPAALEEHNRTSSEAARFRLRLAVNVGPVFSSTTGVSGEAIIVAERLLDAPSFQEAIARSRTSIGVIISPFVYETVVRQASDLTEVASYTQIPVEVKESSTIAWMKLIAPDPVPAS